MHDTTLISLYEHVGIKVDVVALSTEYTEAVFVTRKSGVSLIAVKVIEAHLSDCTIRIMIGHRRA